MKYILTLLISLSFLIGGCTTTLTNSEQIAATLAIKYATLRVIEEAEDQTTVANRIVEIAEQAQELVDSGTVTLVDDLVGRIRERIDWAEMDASRSLLAEALLEAAKLELENRIQGGSLNPETVVVLSQMLQDIITTARLHTQ